MLRTLRKCVIGARTRGASLTRLSLQAETAIQNWITMALEMNWQARRRLRFPSRATLRRPVCRPPVQRKVALRTQTPAVLVGLIGPLSNHGGSNSSSEGGVSGPGATYITITCVAESLGRNRELELTIQFTVNGCCAPLARRSLRRLAEQPMGSRFSMRHSLPSPRWD
jgi:hypothetical protein